MNSLLPSDHSLVETGVSLRWTIFVRMNREIEDNETVIGHGICASFWIPHD